MASGQVVVMCVLYLAPYIVYIVTFFSYSGAKHNLVQFQKNLEQFQVAELLVTIIQQYSAMLGVQVTERDKCSW